MIVNQDSLRRDTVALIRDIDKQIEEITRYAKQINVEPHRLRDAQGNWALTPLLQAKATAYNTLVLLQVTK